MPWWIREIKRDYRYFFSKLFYYVKVRGWTLPEVSPFELLAGYLSLRGNVSGCAYEAFKKKHIAPKMHSATSTQSVPLRRSECCDSDVVFDVAEKIFRCVECGTPIEQ